ncbi:MBL fold metallo-hydrolase [Streptomyces yunnanensis]|uniref:Glyoxylase, beta-lactamase superfamily II n=1 Tax=Streptomyces yunnanensis TaxID=156453 RepID=A0A9X8MQI5_9ACTN|nr:MBL fold metallo-hydrolase [Streptomyces yunnanensis]SHL44770.1 Glyoxylase, beta-lactamase superfamily II [Streptomyces yunnanensis]
MDTLALGNVEITRVVELSAKGRARDYVFPDVPVEHWQAHENWLTPTFLDLAADEVHMMIQSWLVRSEGRTILIDTGVGNNRERPGMPAFHHLHTDYLERLAAAGVRPPDVDTVICTHVHSDHVGWNTHLTADGQWRPTFPNAQYLIPRADFDYWNPANGHRTRAGRRMANVFEDSVAPVHRAGQAVLWEGDHHDIDAQLRIEPAPGHTPGSSVVWLRSGTERAVFVGDLVHSPLQIAEPDDCPGFDEDEPRARNTRRRVLGEAADRRALLFPAHFPGPGAAAVRRVGDRFAVQEWATWR